MKDAITTAHQKCSELSFNGLTIFMAPEYYFRGPRGAYSLELLSSIPGQLSDEIYQDKYKDWLFVLGTAVGVLKNEQSGAVEIFNVAYVMKGGCNRFDLEGFPYDHIVYKERKALDFRAKHPVRNESGEVVLGKINLPEEANRDVIIGHHSVEDFFSMTQMTEGAISYGEVENQWPRSASLSEFSQGPAQHLQNIRPLQGECVFRMDGINFGLEVCADHLEGRLLHSTNCPKIQIQLIPSAGVATIKEHVVVECGGLIFNVDGKRLPSDTPCRQFSYRSGRLTSSRPPIRFDITSTSSDTAPFRFSQPYLDIFVPYPISLSQ